MKKKSVFRIAAEMIHNGFSQGCCGAISMSLPDISIILFSDEERLFISMMKPNRIEMKRFNARKYYWMASIGNTHKQDQNDRILALLICEQIWLSEQNEKRQEP